MDLGKLFRARSVALIGASDKNPWTALVMRSLQTVGFDGHIHLVNSRGSPALGRATVQSCADLKQVDAAFVALPAAALLDGIEDMAAGGVRYGAVVTSGFSEVGGQGAAEQARIFSRAQALGVTLLGPNSLGFTNFVERVSLGAIPLHKPMLTNPCVGLISQSGATAALIYGFAHQQNVSLSYSVAMGNEAMVDLSDVMDYLIADPTTRCLAIFIETIRNPAKFRAAARAAAQAQKPIVVFKVGVGTLTAAVAQAHTGAMVGDDRVFQSVCDDFNLIRVESIEDLVTTSDVLAKLRPDPLKGFALISISGGACEIFADRGEESGIPFPPFSAPTREALAHVLPDFAAGHNPLDITGAAMRNPEIYSGTIQAISRDSQIGLMGIVAEVPVSQASESPMSAAQLTQMAHGLVQTTVPGVLIQQTIKPITDYGREVLARHGLPAVTGGLDHAVRAIGNLYTCLRRQTRELPAEPPRQGPSAEKPANEYLLLKHLANAGVPVIPQVLVTDREQAVAAAHALEIPVVLKVLSPDIQHKTEAGGVLLDLHGDDTVAAGFDTIQAQVKRSSPHARIDGLLLSPMRRGGVELLVGVARDPNWGLVMAVGLGGIWVELLKDTQLKVLPVNETAALGMLKSLKGAALLQGHRGARPVNLERVARAIARISNVALALGSELEALEINPLRVEGDDVEALDALAIWKES